MTTFEEIALYIDNCSVSLALVLEALKTAIHSGSDVNEAVKNYILNNAVKDMRTYGRSADRSVAVDLGKAIKKADFSTYKALTKHYLNKHKEGCNMSSFLPK